MTIFVDASAMVAIMAGEPDAEALTRELEAHDRRLCSALSFWEVVAGLSRSYGVAPAVARTLAQDFVVEAEITFIGIGEPEAIAAADAYAKFGKGRHRASLNMGDCFAYACAKLNRAELLYKGQDFVHTDLA